MLEDMNRVNGLDNFLISVNAASQQDNKQQEDEVTNAE